MQIRLGELRSVVREAIAVDENPDLQPLVDAGMELLSTQRQLDNGTYVFHSPNTMSTFAIFTDLSTGAVKRIEHANDNSHHSQSTKVRNDGTLPGAVQAVLGFADRKLDRDAKSLQGASLEVSIGWTGTVLAVNKQVELLASALGSIGDGLTVKSRSSVSTAAGPEGTFNSDEIGDVIEEWVSNSQSKHHEGELYGGFDLTIPTNGKDDVRTKVSRALRPFTASRNKVVSCSVRVTGQPERHR